MQQQSVGYFSSLPPPCPKDPARSSMTRALQAILEIPARDDGAGSERTGPGPLNGGRMSSLAGRFEVQAVPTGPKLGMGTAPSFVLSAAKPTLRHSVPAETQTKNI